ncbi:hypothetical protein V5F77_11850 [Xanthobacter sp. DSM 24535]|uniref:hypothetical protein n=1 Tax=Roseixanthobacter psychrophilus TaxID=3119917 RepID=UPI003727CD62
MSKVVTSLSRTGRAVGPWLMVAALVFQLVLASTFATRQAFAADASSNILCLNDAAAPENGTADGITKALVHCPLCLSRVDVALLPPPSAIFLSERLALRIRYDETSAAPKVAVSPRLSHRPRAPPPLSA